MLDFVLIDTALQSSDIDLAVSDEHGDHSDTTVLVNIKYLLSCHLQLPYQLVLSLLQSRCLYFPVQKVKKCEVDINEWHAIVTSLF